MGVSSHSGLMSQLKYKRQKSLLKACKCYIQTASHMRLIQLCDNFRGQILFVHKNNFIYNSKSDDKSFSVQVGKVLDKWTGPQNVRK